jgi:hypothetical protein
MNGNFLDGREHPDLWACGSVRPTRVQMTNRDGWEESSVIPPREDGP